MPIIIENGYDRISLRQLVELQTEGFSVLKSPHVGNQHPSNLLCGKLGIPMDMVSFTMPERDKNFHPHRRIEGGSSTVLFDKKTPTQFATVADGRTATDYHQSSVQKVFPYTDIGTDIEKMLQNEKLTMTVLRKTNEVVSDLWYRKVSVSGEVTKGKGCQLSERELENNVFQVSNSRSGWVVPNQAHIVFALVWQTLSSGRDIVYHVSGPQMGGYIRGIAKNLSVMYDSVRVEAPSLPETLTVRIVPLAFCRLVSKDVGAVSEFDALMHEYETSSVSRRRFIQNKIGEFVKEFPEFTVSIETATTLSQYDLVTSDDLVVSNWMMETPLYRVRNIYQKMLLAHGKN